MTQRERRSETDNDRQRDSQRQTMAQTERRSETDNDTDRETVRDSQ